MKLIQWIIKQKNNKTRLIFTFFTIIVVLFAIFLLVYDIVSIVKLQQTGSISTSFISINVIGIFLAGLDLIFLIVLLILSKKEITSK